MLTGRERILQSLAFEETERAPMDLAGMLSTGISCFAYPRLVEALGLPARPPRVHDTGQMLALPDVDVLDALGCDAVTVLGDVTNAFDQPDTWRPYDFNGRLPAFVREPERFKALADGTILQNGGVSKMPPTSHVFEAEHGGQPLYLTGDIPKPDLRQVKKDKDNERLSEAAIQTIKEVCRRARESTGRAVFFNGPGAGIGIAGWGGMAVFPVLCLTEPDFVAELHEIVVNHAVEQIGALLSEIHPYIDVYMCGSDDWGTQAQTIAAPEVFRDLFMPYYRRVNDEIHRVGPNVKAFLHSCGAVYDIIEYVIESGFDVLNPVQWTAGGHSYKEWKDKSRGRIALWGGGINSQVTLPLGTLEDVEREVAEIVSYMKKDGGFVFNGIHNILAEVPAENVVAMYRAAAAVR